MKKGDEASPSIILAGRALLVKMLITLEPRYAFGLNYEYFFFLFFFFFFFLILHCPATGMQNEASLRIILAD